MTRKTYGLIAGLVVAGISMWWRTRGNAGMLADGEAESGKVIFDNTPRASTPDGDI